MNYLHNELDANGGDVVRVDLEGNAANVLLLDSANYNAYQRGGRYTYRGGYATRSPVLLTVPHAGRWHVVIDLGGGRGNVRAAVALIAA